MGKNSIISLDTSEEIIQFIGSTSLEFKFNIIPLIRNDINLLVAKLHLMFLGVSRLPYIFRAKKDEMAQLSHHTIPDK